MIFFCTSLPFFVNVKRKYVCNSNNLRKILIGCRNDFATYADTCFQKFGDRVKNWITFNEPHTFAVQGYDVGLQAPGRCSILLHLFCRAGNSETEPYIVAHNVLLSHATVTDIYRTKYKVR
jgi:beta-glucosidase